MGLNNERTMRGALVFDVEAVPIDGAETFLEEPTAPSNYVKADAIANYIAKAKAEQLSKCSLDPDLARIVTIGVQHSDREAIPVLLCRNESDEREALHWFWSMVEPYPFPRLIGYNVIGYDLPLMLRRSFYLGVNAPPIPIGKYRHPDVDDLMLTLSFDGALKFRGLAFYCKRLGIDVADPMTGADVPHAIAEGRWADVEAHVRADIQKIAALATRLGLFQPVTAEVL